MPPTPRIPVAILFAALIAGGFVRAEVKPAFAAEQLDFFEQKIRPVLVEQCYKCHSAQSEKLKGGLYLDSRAGALKGGDTAPAVVPGDAEKSLLIQSIRYGDEDLQMPPKHRLSPQQVADFEQWVKMGAPDPRDQKLPEKPSSAVVQAKDLWSLQPVADPAPPAVKTAGWVRNPIDGFMLAKMEAKGVKPVADADPRSLLRRVTYDLTGLPPTPEETQAFLADPSPEALAKTVERLLASPAYGEQWGRHWLDVVRYADTSGCNSDFPVPSAYRYRNWVIGSFNSDLPYDEFLRQQIAGDLLPAASDEERQQKTVATGYLAIARRFGSRGNEFHLTIEDLIDNLGKATLGLSLSCARCHDHKFDPVSNRDYYALYGIFDSTKYAFPGTEILRHTRNFVPLVADKAEAEKFRREMDELSDLDEKIENLKDERKKLKRQEKAEVAAAAPPADPAQAPAPPEKPKRTSDDAQRELDAALARQAELELRAEALPKAYAVSEGRPHSAKIQKKGDPNDLGAEVPRGWLSALGGQTLPADEAGSGRRQLAEWLTDPANPLTARVMVNRVWQHHFGRGIVRTPNDFGARGEAPTHPELLDWLTKRFVEGGWSVKKLHRLIVLSRAYQLASADDAANSQLDPTNDLLWHFTPRRLSAEELRDSILAAAGTLDRTPGERHPFPPEKDWRYTQHKQFYGDYPTAKRTVYVMQQRIAKQPFLAVWDGADTNAPTAVRSISTTPIQALWMMNDKLAHEQAAKFAERVTREAADEPARIQRAYALALGRAPDADEFAAAQQFLADIAQELKSTSLPPGQHSAAALASFARVLLGSNEFVVLN